MKYFISAILFLVLVFFGLGLWYWWELQTVVSQSRSGWQFDISKNQTASSILNDLRAEGIIRSSLAAKIYLKLSGQETKLLPGGYQIPFHLSTPQIIRLITTGPEDIWVTIPEGWRREQIAVRLKKSLINFNPYEFAAVSAPFEGQLFPDTYLIPAEATPSDTLRIFLKNFTQKTGLNPAVAKDRQTLILASLVEREAKSDPDRKMIAGILQKRLENNWPLQVDASVQYAVASKSCLAIPIEQCEWWQAIVDTKYPSFYNTYLYPGLPPAPICNPGLASIQAVQTPQVSPYWYYLTGSDGVTRYAKNLAEHNLNIDKYLKP